MLCRSKVYGVTLVLCLLGLVLVAACQAAPAPPSAGAPSPAQEKKPDTGGIFSYYIGGEPTNLNGLSENIYPGLLMHGLLYEGLTDVKRDVDWRVEFPVIPRLAERWENPDPTTYIFYLRKGAKWSDGEPFTADDVIVSFDYLRSNPFRLSTNLRDVKELVKIDNNTLKITLKGASPMFLYNLSGYGAQAIAVLPKHIYDKAGEEGWKTAGVTMGPFKLRSFDKSSRTVMERNPNYWGKDKDGTQLPYMDGIIVTHNVDPSARVAGFQAGRFDIVGIDTKKEVDPVVAVKKDAKVYGYVMHHVYSAFPNMTRKPWDDVRVRQAVQLAIDRWEMNEALAFGEGMIEPPISPAIKTGWGMSQEELLKLPGFRKDKTEDLAKARQLLSEAGYPGGFKTSNMHIRTFVWTPGQSEMMASQLKKVGIDMEVRFIDEAQFFKLLKEMDFDTGFHLLGNPDPALNAYSWLHSKGAFNYGVKDPEVDDLIEKLGMVMDVNERKQIVRRLQQILLDKVYYWPLTAPRSYTLAQPWVNNYYPAYSSQVSARGQVDVMWLDANKVPKRTLP